MAHVLQNFSRSVNGNNNFFIEIMSYKFAGFLATAMVTAISGLGAPPKGWFTDGDHVADYEIGVDSKVTHGGKASAGLKSIVAEAKGFGTLMQEFKADQYRGKRLRLSGYVKAEQ